MAPVSANSLFIKCGVAAAIYYLPQDLGVLSILALNKRSITGPIANGPSDAQVDRVILNYMKERGFTSSSYSVKKEKRNTVVRLC